MFDSFIQSYGYYAVFAFACIEGEVAVLTAGFLCKQGLLSLPLVMFYAFLGTVITEQSLFSVGKTHGAKLMKKYPNFAKRSDKAIEFLRKYNSAFIFGSRFIYGIRNISPMIIGMAGISPVRFSLLNIPAAIIWSLIVAGAGYVFADFLESAKENLQYVQYAGFGILCLSFGYFIYKKFH